MKSNEVIYGLCVDSRETDLRTFGMYEVEFVPHPFFYPYGVKLKGWPHLFFMQRFHYFVMSLN